MNHFSALRFTARSKSVNAMASYSACERRRTVPVLPNVRANRRAAADGDWPRKDNWHCGLERPGDDCRSVSG
jgi:hypothetical protein